MRSHSYLFALFVVVLVFGAIGSLLMGTKYEPAPLPPEQEAGTIPLPQTAETTPPPNALGTTTDAGQLMITVSTPFPNTKVTSPLQVTGSARGNWYFEASFPIRLVDTKGNTILQTHAQAQGEWMTENFVPFTATLTWSSTSTTATSGVLIFMRDNPSGLPQNDAQIEIPVTF